MENSNPLLNLIQGIGAAAELAKLYYDSYLRVGFPPAAALELTKHVIQTQMMIATMQNGGNENGTD